MSRLRVIRLLSRLFSKQSSQQSSEPKLHSEFVHLFGWQRNSLAMQGEALGKPEYKIQFFFDSQEMDLLSRCPFPCKFGECIDPDEQFEFCGFVHPLAGQKLKDVERWAMRFRKAAVFTFGSYTGGKWIPGIKTRDLAL